jgi:hypothetical protein
MRFGGTGRGAGGTRGGVVVGSTYKRKNRIKINTYKGENQKKNQADVDKMVYGYDNHSWFSDVNKKASLFILGSKM